MKSICVVRLVYLREQDGWMVVEARVFCLVGE